MKSEDVITAIEKWQIRLQPCMAGRRWGAICWVNGVAYSVRQRPNVTLAVRDLVKQLAGLTPTDCRCPTPSTPPIVDPDDDDEDDDAGGSYSS